MFHRNGTIDVHEFSALWKYIQDWKACFDRWVSQFRYSVMPASSLYSYRYFMSHFWMIDLCNFTEHSVTFSGSTPIDQETSTLPSFALHFTVSATTCKGFCFLLRECVLQLLCNWKLVFLLRGRTRFVGCVCACLTSVPHTRWISTTLFSAASCCAHSPNSSGEKIRNRMAPSPFNTKRFAYHFFCSSL